MPPEFAALSTRKRLATFLTPECAAVVSAALDSLSAPMGAEDTRTHGQRYHHALAEAMRWL